MIGVVNPSIACLPRVVAVVGGHILAVLNAILVRT